VDEFDGTKLAQFSIFECCVHSWDIAQALGVDGSFSDELAQFGYDAVAPHVDYFREIDLLAPTTIDATSADSVQTRVLRLAGRVT
jgi:hypothetical protein